MQSHSSHSERTGSSGVSNGARLLFEAMFDNDSDSDSDTENGVEILSTIDRAKKSIEGAAVYHTTNLIKGLQKRERSKIIHEKAFHAFLDAGNMLNKTDGFGEQIELAYYSTENLNEIISAMNKFLPGLSFTVSPYATRAATRDDETRKVVENYLDQRVASVWVKIDYSLFNTEAGDGKSANTSQEQMEKVD